MAVKKTNSAKTDEAIKEHNKLWEFVSQKTVVYAIVLMAAAGLVSVLFLQ